MGDFLYRFQKWLIEGPVRVLEQLTSRRAIFMISLALLVFALAQTFPVEITVMFAGDAMTWFEVVTAVTLLAMRGHSRVALNAARQWVAWKLFVAPIRRSFARAWRRVGRGPQLPKVGDEDHGPV